MWSRMVAGNNCIFNIRVLFNAVKTYVDGDAKEQF